MPHAGRDPFEVSLDTEARKTFVDEMVLALEDAREARSDLDEDAEYWMSLYEQKRTRLATNTPWPDAADLTSYIGTEKVDALHARLLRTIFTEPIWTVEGWGEAAARAPIVEEFHQWKAEEERLQSALDRAFLLALIEPMAIHEVVEGTETRFVRERVIAKLAIDPVTGAAMLDEQGQPVLARNADGDIETSEVEAPGTARTVVDRSEQIRTGPVHRIIPFRDFYILPGHARDRAEIWGYAKRFYRRLNTLNAAGIYDEEAVKTLTEEGEHSEEAAEQRAGVTVLNTAGPRAEKELWEFLVLWDFDDGTGERWYLATIHLGTRALLRLQHDDLGAKRYILYVPIPRPDSVYGYSLIGDKLITVIEEHSAWRNMLADKASMAIQGPLMRISGALWHPDEQSLGPKAVLTVRSMDEIRPLILPDVPRGAENRLTEIVQAGERLAGINDTATGQTAQSGTTLGEVQLVAQQSFVRMDTMVKRIQEQMEELGQIRNEIWVRALAEQDDGMNLPSKALMGLEHRGIDIPQGAVTAETLSGAFRFKPRGSVESADLNRKRSDLVQFLQFFAQMSKTVPAMAQKLSDPQVINAIFEEAIRVFDFENRQAFLGPPGQQAGVQAEDPLAALTGQLGGGGGLPQLPPELLTGGLGGAVQ